MPPKKDVKRPKKSTKKKLPHLIKGSKAAKEHMAKLRAMRGVNKKKKTARGGGYSKPVSPTPSSRSTSSPTPSYSPYFGNQNGEQAAKKNEPTKPINVPPGRGSAIARKRPTKF